MRGRKRCGKIPKVWLGNCKGPYISCHPMGFQRAATEKHNRVDRWSQTKCSGFDAIKSCLPRARLQRVWQTHCDDHFGMTECACLCV